MSQVEFAALEDVERAAFTDYFRAAPEATRAAHHVHVFQAGSVRCLACTGLEPGVIFRRVLGLGIEEPADEAQLDAVLAHMNALRQSYMVSVSPHAQPATLGAWLEARGFKRSYAWMKFMRPLVAAVPTTNCDLDVRVVGRECADAFGRVVTEGFGMQAPVAPWVAQLPGRPDWTCVMAFDGTEPVATGAVYVKGGYAWLGFGTTLSSHRRHGAQNALLARRLQEAAARGARVAVTETGERVPGKPDNSYRNILRAGFVECYLQQNYLSP
jgi:hypothetical protein